MNRRAITLVEVLIYVAILPAVTLSTMAALSRGRLLMGVARERQNLTLIAQEELDRIRLLPPSELSDGVTFQADGDVVTTTTLSRVGPHWEVQVEASRHTIDGLQPMYLATLRRGETP
jgi:type II secretory pathway pseudopilin PulG